MPKNVKKQVKTRLVTMRMPVSLVKKVDKQAKLLNITRTDFVTHLLNEKTKLNFKIVGEA